MALTDTCSIQQNSERILPPALLPEGKMEESSCLPSWDIFRLEATRMSWSSCLAPWWCGDLISFSASEVLKEQSSIRKKKRGGNPLVWILRMEFPKPGEKYKNPSYIWWGAGWWLQRLHLTSTELHKTLQSCYLLNGVHSTCLKRFYFLNHMQYIRIARSSCFYGQVSGEKRGEGVLNFAFS